MKKQFLLFAAATLFSVSSLMAQAGRQMSSPEERTKATMEKINQFNLSSDNYSKVQTILMDFYKSAQTVTQEMRASGADRNAMMEKRKGLADERDAKLKAVFTAEEYQKWVDEIEPTTRPQRMQAPPAAPAEKKGAPAEKKAAPAN
ncbi:MAG: hypothetical protein QM737_10785 [Ferruginibacter sp.]